MSVYGLYLELGLINFFLVKRKFIGLLKNEIFFKGKKKRFCGSNEVNGI